ncbi:MAG: DMT family transporter [Candidatus Latescibacterota bacterium]
MQGWGFLWATIFLFSTIEVATKIILREIVSAVGAFTSYDALVLAGFRFFIGGVFLIAVAPGRWWRALRKMARRDRIRLGLLGFLGVPAYTALFHLGLRTIPAAQGAVIFSMTPIFVAGLAPALLKESLTLRKIAGILVGFVGVIILCRLDGSFGRVSAGSLLMLCASFFFALYTVLGKRIFGSSQGPLIGTTFVLGSLPFVPLLWMDSVRLPSQIFSNSLVFLNVFHLGLIATGLGYLFYFKGLHRVGASRGTTLFYLKPLFASLLAAVILGEGITTTMVAGTAVILSGLFLVTGASESSGKSEGQRDVEAHLH